MSAGAVAAAGAEGLLFDGEDIRVRANLGFGSTVAFVTFSSRSERADRGGFRSDGFGEHFLASRAIDHLCFINKRNHWWQSAEVGEALALVRSAGMLERYRQIVVYGASMGGYGALLGADRLGADLCLAFSPQFRIDGSLPLVAAWANDLAGNAVVLEPFAEAAEPRGRLALLLDPGNSVDRAHARAIQARVPAVLVAIPMATHSAALYLHEIGLLAEFLIDAAEERFDALAARRRIRETRIISPRYWYGLGTKLAARGRKVRSEAAFARALDLSLDDPRCADSFLHDQVKRAALIALKRRRPKQAESLADRYLAARPGESSPAMIASLIARETGQAEQAVDYARQAVAAEPKLGWPQQILARALIAAGRPDEAGSAADRARKLKRSDRREWVALSTAFERIGRADLALDAARSALRLRAGDPVLRTLVQRIERMVSPPTD